MADQIVVMNGGRVMQAGTPQEVYEQPANPFVAEFIGAVNFLPAWVRPQEPGVRCAIRPEHVQLGAADAVRYVATAAGRSAACRVSRCLLQNQPAPEAALWSERDRVRVRVCHRGYRQP